MPAKLMLFYEFYKLIRLALLFFYGIDVGNMGVDFMNDAGNMDKALLV